MRRPIALALAGLALALGVTAAPAAAPASPPGPKAATQPATTRVVIVGVPGLAWSDVTPEATPAIWALAEAGSIGSLSVRAAAPVTRPYDGWATLGAGNRTALPDEPPEPAYDGQGATDPAIAPLQRANAAKDFDAVAGALGDTLHAAGRTTAALGRGAVLALADGQGRVDVAAAAGDPAAFLTGPARDAGVVAIDVVGRRDPVAADRVVAGVQAALAENDLLLVVGVSDDVIGPAGLRVAIATGPRFGAGRLVSASTRRAGYVQLIDVAPTVAAALVLPQPPAMVGQPWRATGGRHAGEVARLVDAAEAADAHRRFVPPFFTILVALQLALYAGSWLAVNRLGRVAGRRDQVLRIARHGAVAFTAAPVATYLAHIVPWWRHRLWFLLLAVAIADLLVVAIAYAGPWRRAVLGPPGAVAAITALVLAADMLTGARLQMSSLAGYSPIVAGRFAGFGNVAFAVFAAGALLGTAAACEGRSRRVTAVIAVTAGLAATIVDGSPTWGSDFGGVLALVPSYAVLAMLLLGIRLSWRRLLLVGVGTVAAVTAFAVFDYSRPPEARSHLGRFVAQVMGGGAATVIERKARANLRLLQHSVLTLLVPFATAFVAVVLLRPRGALRTALQRHPALRAGLVATLVLGVVGFFVNDSGVAVPALVLTVAVPFALSASLRSADEEHRE